MFVQGWISVPEKVTTVDKALGVNFDYSEIMRRGL